MTAASFSRFAPREISNLLVGLIIFFSATQLGLHFWPNSTLVYGIRIDYLSPTVYLFDLLLLSYLIARRSVLKRNSRLQVEKGSAAAERTDLVGIWNLSETRSDPQSIFENLRIYDLRILLPLLLTNLLFSVNPLSTLSWSLHLLLYLAFICTLLPTPGSDLLRKSWPSAKMFSRPRLAGETRSDPQSTIHGILRLALTLSLLFQTILALAQVALGHSLGGLMYYLGERMVSVGAPGVATASFMGATVLRAYGTFSHPNILAGFAVITTLIILRLVRLQSPKPANTPSIRGSDLLRKSWLAAKMFSRPRLAGETRSDLIGTWIPLLLTTTLVLLTQSRSDALALFGLVIPLYLLRSWRLRLFYFAILLTTSYYLLTTGHLSRNIDLSISQRQDLQTVSFLSITKWPIFGAGANASISTYPTTAPNFRLLQPDHNSLTLLLSWFGLFGALALGSDLLRRSWPTAKMFSRTSKVRSETRSDPQSIALNILSLAPLLPLLLLDHYLLTSPQGLFILLLYLHISKH